MPGMKKWTDAAAIDEVNALFDDQPPPLPGT
jgi:hypothetical protein